jgi:hypothetical protein
MVGKTVFIGRRLLFELLLFLLLVLLLVLLLEVLTQMFIVYQLQLDCLDY